MGQAGLVIPTSEREMGIDREKRLLSKAAHDRTGVNKEHELLSQTSVSSWASGHVFLSLSFLICDVGIKESAQGLPCGPVAKTPHFQCRGTGLIPA